MSLNDLIHLVWPAEKLGEALIALNHRAGMVEPTQVASSSLTPLSLDQQPLEAWLPSVGRQLGLDVLPVQSTYAELHGMVRSVAPAIFHLPNNRFLVALRGNGHRITLIAPNLSLQRLPTKIVCEALTHHLALPLTPHIHTFLERSEIPKHRQQRATQAILSEQLGTMPIEGCWLVRPLPQAHLSRQIRQTHLSQQVISVIVAYTMGEFLTVLSGWVILQWLLQEQQIWLTFFALVLLTAIPFQLLRAWQTRLLSVSFGAIFRQHFLSGILRFDPEPIRHQGAGHFLGQIMEAEAIEALALRGGFRIVASLVEMLAATVLLTVGADAVLYLMLFFLWFLIVLLLAWRYFVVSRHWITVYRQMTNDLVERMIGHRTRLAQERHDQWHGEEDSILNRYLLISQQFDGRLTQLDASVSRGWLIIGFLVAVVILILSFASPTSTAVTLGGGVLAASALRNFAGGIKSFVGVVNAWEQLTMALQTKADISAEPNAANLVDLEWGETNNSDGAMFLQGQRLRYRYPSHPHLVLQDVDIAIHRGDCLLLEGPSGSGKSTLAGVLAGLRTAEAGLLLLDGFDRETIGENQWRGRILLVPQFHDNHVFTETLAFNLLMGHRWPPRAEDLAQAETICRELGLSDLLDKMPSGLQQIVGENGWRLSLGERSRLYIARALLQRADLLILDESFAVLDPQSLQIAFDCVRKYAPTLLVIAHH